MYPNTLAKDSEGTGAIEQISERLQKDLPRLRSFSARNIKNMRNFYEEWQPSLKTVTAENDFPQLSKSAATAADLENSEIVQIKLLHS